MPRPLLKPLATQTQTNTILSATMHSEQKQQTTQEQKMKIDRLLRQKRSKRYMEALAALDAGGHVMNRAQVERILDAIRNEFPEVELQGILLGYVSKCYLGKPYEVHTLDPNNQIIEHYKGTLCPTAWKRLGASLSGAAIPSLRCMSTAAALSAGTGPSPSFPCDGRDQFYGGIAT